MMELKSYEAPYYAVFSILTALQARYGVQTWAQTESTSRNEE
jgi:hypothetical protein